ncbi:MAG TPA: glycosyltransferase family 1 protein [Acidobacteriota bacterium]|nr:glycosyltransferase family 1 protein [Acidobacteriota bacterium]
MQIGYDASSIRPRPSGVGYYTSSLLRELQLQYPDHRFLILSHLADLSLSGQNLVFTQRISFPIKEVWMQFWLPRILDRHRPDLCHFTNGIAPLRISMPYVVTVHDLSLIEHPEWHPRSRRLWMRRLLLPSVAGAAGVLCDSEATRQRLLQWASIDKSRTWVIPLAARESFFEARSETEKERIRARYELPRPFILYVGNIEPRKNLSRLLEAFRRLKPREVDLVLAGRCAWLWDGILREVQQTRKAARVHLLDYVREDDLPALYQSALAFAYPSLMEGFGLPVLEAMASGTPVLVSRVEPLVSLVDGAGWLVPPEKIGAWQDALAEAIEDAERRILLAAKGREKSSQYSWARTARETMSCYKEIAS